MFPYAVAVINPLCFDMMRVPELTWKKMEKETERDLRGKIYVYSVFIYQMYLL
jgi:hypothetical protein